MANRLRALHQRRKKARRRATWRRTVSHFLANTEIWLDGERVSLEEAMFSYHAGDAGWLRRVQ